MQNIKLTVDGMTVWAKVERGNGRVIARFYRPIDSTKTDRLLGHLHTAYGQADQTMRMSNGKDWGTIPGSTEMFAKCAAALFAGKVHHTYRHWATWAAETLAA